MKKITSIIQSIDSLHPSRGGPSEAVVNLTDALTELSDFNVTIYSQSYADEALVIGSNPNVKRCISLSKSHLKLKVGIPIRKALLTQLKIMNTDLVHINGIWTASSHWTSSIARQNNIPTIIQTHGMLSPWALSQKAIKKKLALNLYQRNNLLSAKVLIATAQAEYEIIRNNGFKQPIAIIPNGVILKSVEYNTTCKGALGRGQRIALFLGRITMVKGLINLIDAWELKRPLGWRLLIAGPDEDGYLSEVMIRVRDAKLEEVVIYIGEVQGTAKDELYKSVNLFILPSFTENFGIVVAEALSYGVPVITTQGTPWSDLIKYGCGWWIPIGVLPLADTISIATSLSEFDLNEMGKRGVNYVKRYDWTNIANMMAELYRWMLSQADKPDFVMIEK